MAWHLLHAGDYLRALERGYPDGFWWRFLIHLSGLFSQPPRLVTEPRFSGGESLVDWRLVFCEDSENVVLSLRDKVLLEPHWLRENSANLAEFASKAGAQRAVLVANDAGPDDAAPADENVPGYLIVETDPVRAAEQAYRTLVPMQRKSEA